MKGDYMLYIVSVIMFVLFWMFTKMIGAFMSKEDEKEINTLVKSMKPKKEDF